ncbi:MAG: hypothetical protein ACW98I_08730 [Candidatus Hodarchaeales archaeon]|jgi:hypothetical protein
MSLVIDVVDLIFSFYFYIFLWVLLVILTFFLLRKLLQDYKHQRILKNSKNLVESEDKKVKISEIRFFLEQDSNFLDKQFKKGRSEFKDQSLKNSPLFQNIFDLLNTRNIKKEFIILLANEMGKIRSRNEFLAESLGSELNFFIDHPEDWIEGLVVISSNKKEQEVRLNKIRASLQDYITKFNETMKIPELNFQIHRNQL